MDAAAKPNSGRCPGGLRRGLTNTEIRVLDVSGYTDDPQRAPRERRRSLLRNAGSGISLAS
jgi:hypothetical protein